MPFLALQSKNTARVVACPQKPEEERLAMDLRPHHLPNGRKQLSYKWCCQQLDRHCKTGEWGKQNEFSQIHRVNGGVGNNAMKCIILLMLNRIENPTKQRRDRTIYQTTYDITILFRDHEIPIKQTHPTVPASSLIPSISMCYYCQ